MRFRKCCEQRCGHPRVVGWKCSALFFLVCSLFIFGIFIFGMVTSFQFCALIGIVSFSFIYFILLKAAYEQFVAILYHIRVEVREEQQTKQQHRNYFQTSFGSERVGDDELTL